VGTHQQGRSNTVDQVCYIWSQTQQVWGWLMLLLAVTSQQNLPLPLPQAVPAMHIHTLCHTSQSSEQVWGEFMPLLANRLNRVADVSLANRLCPGSLPPFWGTPPVCNACGTGIAIVHMLQCTLGPSQQGRHTIVDYTVRHSQSATLAATAPTAVFELSL